MNPQDPASFNHQLADVNGKTYHYIDAGKGDIVFLLHGFPDLWFGWRYQIPFLVSQGYRVIVPDMLGYGRTSAPYAPPSDLAAVKPYSFLSVCTDLAALLTHVTGSSTSSAVFIGHDWGSATAWRMCLHFPQRVKAVAGLCVPFYPPTDEFINLERRAEKWAQFRYQVYCSRSEADDELGAMIPQFLNALYRGTDEDNNKFMYLDSFKKLPHDMPRTQKLALSEKEFEYYLSEFQRTGLHGPLNWYRTRLVNFQDEKRRGSPKKIHHPALFIPALNDEVIPPILWKPITQTVPGVTVCPLPTGHWIMMEMPDKVNSILGEWLASLQKSKL
ncbi:alpha beta-hydrolase [Geranomyces variabilis]|nr:alpha beta-hydrolase [Geranomyces variabilis]KAJ3133853.1 hypothetical protein HDU90_005461 [Geranomyces variabilis]